MLFDENVENVCLTRNTNALSLLLQNCPVIISIQLLFLIIQKFSEKHGGGKTVAVAFEISEPIKSKRALHGYFTPYIRVKHFDSISWIVVVRLKDEDFFWPRVCLRRN